MPFRFRKKPWDNVQCVFDLQEYGITGSKGWTSVFTIGEAMSIADARDKFEPGKHYRLLARSTENGKMVGMVWKHYEPTLGGLVAVDEKEEKEKRKQKGPSDPAERMQEYADEVSRVLAPIGTFYKAMDGIRDSLFPTQPQVVQVAEGGTPPELEFDGKAPWYLHPYIVRTLGDEVTRVMDHFFGRLEAVGLWPGKKAEEEEEDVQLPAFPPVSITSPQELPQEEEVLPEEVEEPETTFPELMPTEEPKEDEEMPGEAVPVTELSEDVLACLECGEVKPLGGNSLCEDCNKKKAEAATSG